jgi:hypothetical protein
MGKESYIEWAKRYSSSIAISAGMNECKKLCVFGLGV